jgi:hypothetical protein
LLQFAGLVQVPEGQYRLQKPPLFYKVNKKGRITAISVAINL